MKKILVTGGSGFLGHHFCEHIIKNTDWDIYIMDNLSYASFGYSRLKDVNVYSDERSSHFCHDFTLPIGGYLMEEINDVDIIVHMGAETHVDNSIIYPERFVMANVVGTVNMLNFARQCKRLQKFVYFSTDEVFGPAPDQVKYKEWDRYKSSNPYAATKAGGEELCIAYHNTYNLPVIVTHTMNIFGERQHPEKFIPKAIKAILNDEEIQIHSDATKTIPGSRFWIHARNVSDALLFLLKRSDVGDKYNIVGEKEVNNLQMAQYISEVLGKPLKYKMVDFHSSRPGHDLRYALDGGKLERMGYRFPKNFEQSLRKTIEWAIKPENLKWIQEGADECLSV